MVQSQERVSEKAHKERQMGERTRRGNRDVNAIANPTITAPGIEAVVEFRCDERGPQ